MFTQDRLRYLHEWRDKERKKDRDAVELHATTCVVMVEWYHFVAMQ